PALLQTIAVRGNRSNGRLSTPARSAWIIRRRGARDARSRGNSEPKPVQTRTSAEAHAASRSDGGRSARMTGCNPAVALEARTARRSASIATEKRTRATAFRTAPAGLGLSTSVGSALRVPAGVALDAALFEDERLAALRALRVQAFPEELRGVAGFLLELDVRLDRAVRLVVRLDGRLHAGLLHPDVPLDRLRDRVGDRVDAFSVVDRDPRAADPFELVDDLVDGDAGPQAEGGEARDSLREGCGIPAAAADLGEDLEEALLVLVDRHVEGAVPGEDLLGAARDHVRPGPRAQGRGFRRDLDSHLRRLLRLCDPDVQDLVLAGAVAVDRDPLAMEVVREEVGFLHVLHGRLPRHVDRLRDGRVRVVLESRLHSYMPLRRNVVSRREDPLPLFGHLLKSPRGAVVVKNFLDEVLAPEALALRHLFEIIEEIRKLIAVHHALVPDQTKFWLASAGCVRNHGNRPGRSDCRHVGVANFETLLPLTTPLPGGVSSALLCQLRALFISNFLYKSHNLAAPFDALLGIVRDLKGEKNSGETHHAEADLARGIGHFFDLFDRVGAHVDHIVERADRRSDRTLQFLPVDFPRVPRVTFQMSLEIDGSQVARFVRKERFLPARIRRFHFAHSRRRLPPAVLIDKEQAWLAILPCLIGDSFEDLAGIELSDDLLVPRIDEVVLRPCLHRLQKFVCDGNRDVEVRNVGRLVLTSDEFEDVRMINSQNPHVSSSTTSALFHGLRRGVEDLHEGNRSRSDAHSRFHEVALRTQA